MIQHARALQYDIEAQLREKRLLRTNGLGSSPHALPRRSIIQNIKPRGGHIREFIETRSNILTTNTTYHGELGIFEEEDMEDKTVLPRWDSMFDKKVDEKAKQHEDDWVGLVKKRTDDFSALE